MQISKFRKAKAPGDGSKSPSKDVKKVPPIHLFIPWGPGDEVVYISQNGESVEDTIKEIHVELREKEVHMLFICKSIRFCDEDINTKVFLKSACKEKGE